MQEIHISHRNPFAGFYFGLILNFVILLLTYFFENSLVWNFSCVLRLFYGLEHTFLMTFL